MRDGGRALVTGASGFVGSHIAETFVRAGYRTRLALRETSDPHWLAGLDAERTFLDVGGSASDPGSFSRALEGVDVVIHAAGLTRAAREEDYHRTNAEGTRRLAEKAREGGVGRFVFVSSLAARGPDREPPDRESSDRESSGGDLPDLPKSAYGRSKLLAEEALRALAGDLEVVALRPAAVYGPRDRDLLPLFNLASRGLLVAPRSGGLLQPVYAEDVAGAALAAANVPDVPFGPFPVAEEARYTWEEAADLLARATGRRARVVRLPAGVFVGGGKVSQRAARLLGRAPAFDERRARDLAVNSWTCRTSGTTRALGWKAETKFAEGLEKSVEWYRGEGWIPPP